MIILSLAGLINAIALPSFTALQSLGKPQLPAMFHVIEALFYIPASYIMIMKFGGVGAAAACLLRVILDALLLNTACCKILGERVLVWYARLVYRAFGPALLCGLLFWFLKSRSLPFLSVLNLGGIILIFALYAAAVWTWGLDSVAREDITEYLKSHS